MLDTHASYIDEESFTEEQLERTTDIQLPPMVNVLLLAIWLAVCLVGFVVIFVVKSPVIGAVIIGVPTFVGMVIKPTFALCMMMLVLPTGAGVGYAQVFSLDRGVGLAVAVSFVVNVLITRPRLRIRNKVLWVLVAYTLWIALASLAAPYRALELRRAFTQIQLLAFVFIIYWIVETNHEKTFRWALRSYVLGTLGTIALVSMTGVAIRAVEETAEGRYAATLGGAINANLLAALTGMGFLAAVYLFARDRGILWRLVYLVAILLLPIMLLRIGSRGNLVALGVTLLSPLLFIRQIAKRPRLAIFMLLVIVLVSISAGVLMKTRGLDEAVAGRLTDPGRARDAINYRLMPIKQAISSTANRPTGTGYYSWFERSGMRIWPHSDFFLILGVYGAPGAALFILFVVLMLRTIMRTPMGLEKLYTRAVLTYLLVVGMNNANVFQKFYWAFMTLVIAGEGIAALYADDTELWPEGEDTELLDVSMAY